MLEPQTESRNAAKTEITKKSSTTESVTTNHERPFNTMTTITDTQHELCRQK